MADSSVYIVSPPTLYLATGGISFCLISNDRVWQEQTSGLLEQGIKDQLTLYTNELGTKDPKAWVWYWHVAPSCSMTFVDTASCTEHEIRMALAMCKEGLPLLFHVRPGNQEFMALLNAIEVPYYEDQETLPDIMQALNG